MTRNSKNLWNKKFDQKMRRYPPITTVLLAVNAAIFLANQFGALQWTISLPGVYGPGALLAHFSHASLMHLLMNVWGIVVISPSLEQLLGERKYATLLLWLWVAQAAILPQVQTAPTLGFSGILMGMLTFFALRLRETAYRGVSRDLLVLVGLNLALPLMIPQISFAGHAIGVVLGGVAYLVARMNRV